MCHNPPVPAFAVQTNTTTHNDNCDDDCGKIDTSRVDLNMWILLILKTIHKGRKGSRKGSDM